MKCKYFDCGWCYAPIDVVTSASSCGSCNYPEHCPYLKTEMTRPTDADNDALFGKDLRVYSKKELETKKMDNVESIEAEIKMLQSKLEFYKELKNTKSPVEEAYKDWYGAYPTDGIAVDNSWDAFQAGYNAAQKDYKVGEHQEPVKQKDTLYDICVKWNDDDDNPPVSDLIAAIEQWLPKEQSANSQNAYVESAVEGFNDCLQKIKSKLR